MNNLILPMNREYVVDFIKKNIEVTSFYPIQEELVDAVLKIVPYIGNYEEEDRKLSFKLSVGMNTTTNNLNGRFYMLQKHTYCEEDSCIRRAKILSMIKKVAALCTANSDIYIVQNENIIECGIYYTDLEKTGCSEESLLNNNFVIFQNYIQNRIEMIGQVDRVLLCFDLDSDRSYSAIAMTPCTPIETTTVYRTWKGIFEKVKKNVHGTICLIVNEFWNPNSDTNFTNSINTIDISISRSELSTADSIYDFENKINMFISMLNYDGITIIDTCGTIRAYNAFCQSKTDSGNIVGGARHRAYNTLKNLPQSERINYVAIYFQSQEGEIEYYEFNNPAAESFYFNPSIMNGGKNNPYLQTVRDHISSTEIAQMENYLSQNSFDEYLTYIDICESVNILQSAHDGIDNFANEPKPSLDLYTKLNNAEYLNTINRHPLMIQKIANTVINCIIGNSYGFSFDAQTSLYNIINLFNVNEWDIYFKKELYICTNLIWVLSHEKLFDRWVNICNYILTAFPSLDSNTVLKYKYKDFLIMRRALEIIEYDL